VEGKAQRLALQVGFERVAYALFSRSGYTPALKERAGREGVELVGVEEMVRGRKNISVETKMIDNWEEE